MLGHVTSPRYPLVLACIALVSLASGCERRSSASEATGKDEHGHIGAGRLPDGWPSSVPAYPGSKITSSVATHTKLVTLETADSVESVAAFYRSNLPGWNKQSDAALANSHMMKCSDGRQLLTIIASKQGDKTHVNLSVEAK